MRKVLVLGIGNRLMMDDGIGVYAVEELKLRNKNPDVRYVVGEADAYYCLSLIKEATYIIIIDAAFLGNKPGVVSTISLHQALENPVQPIFVHESHLLNDIRLGSNDIEGIVICIEPYEVNYGTSLSAVLERKYPKIISEIENIISNI